MILVRVVWGLGESQSDPDAAVFGSKSLEDKFRNHHNGTGKDDGHHIGKVDLERHISRAGIHTLADGFANHLNGHSAVALRKQDRSSCHGTENNHKEQQLHRTEGDTTGSFS